MLKAYSVFKDLDKKVCEILREVGVNLEISNYEERPNKEQLLKLLNEYDILIIGVREKLTKDMLIGINKKKIIATLSIGIIGAGKISREVIKIAKVFNMKIYCNTLNPEKHQDLIEQGVEFLNLDTLLSNSDIITINIPLNEQTNNLISKDKIRLMKKTATLINTSRAEIVDINELIKYADENKTFNVGLDIDVENYKEILSRKRNNVIITPHIAGVTKEAIKRMDIELANRIKEYLSKKVDGGM